MPSWFTPVQFDPFWTKLNQIASSCRQSSHVSLRRLILLDQSPTERRCRRDVLDIPHAMTGRIDVLPALFVVLRRHDLAGQRRAQDVEVDAGGEEAGRQPVGR